MEDTAIIAQAISGAPIGPITAIELLGKGYASLAYSVKTSQGTFIAITQKNDNIEPVDYAYHFAVLQALEDIQYAFAPKAVYVNPECTAIVMTPAAGQPIGWANTASHDQQKEIVTTLLMALLDLRTVSFSQCAKTYQQLSGKDLQTMTLQKDVQHYLIDWLRLAQAAKPDPELIKWIEPKIALCEAAIKNLAPTNQKVLIHGDTSEVNILLSQDLQLTLIDWGGSSFMQYPEGWEDFGMAYIMNHVSLCQQFRPLVISLVSERCQIAPDELEKRIMKTQEFIMLGDIQWAIMMHARSANGEIHDEPQKFLDIAHQRINTYQKMFTNNSFLG